MRETLFGRRRSCVPGLVLLAAGAILTSCSDLPTRPRPTVTVTGRVLDRDGAPLPGARIYFTNQEDELRNPEEYTPLPPQLQGAAVTGQDGRFALSLWTGLYSASIGGPFDEGYGVIFQDGIRVGSGSSPLTFQFHGVWLRGSLIGPGGVPIEDGRVEVYPAPGEPYTGRRSAAVTDRTYKMLLPPGVYDLEGSPYFTNAGIPRLEFDSVPIRADTTVDLVLDGTPIRGIVRGQAGAPLAGVAITVDRPGAWSEARSLADGSYTIYAPPGVYRARLYPEPPLDYILSRETPLVVGDTPTTRDFDLSGVSWTGTVRWAGTGQPVSGATVMVYEATFGFGSAECTADATGMFRLVVKSGGLYQLVARGGSPPLSYSQFVGFITAGADSSFDILLGPEGQPARYTTTAPALTRE